jgi:hypothetical protein
VLASSLRLQYNHHMHKPFEGDPRSKFSKHRERGPAKHFYTAADVAALAGLSVKTLRNYRADGKVDLDSLESVVAFVVERRGRS